MHRIAFPLALALVAGTFSTAFAQQTTSFGSGQQEANILGTLMGEQAALKADLDALQAKIRRLRASAAPTDLAPLTEQVTKIEARLGEIERLLGEKASQADLDLLAGRVTTLEQAPAAAATQTTTHTYTSNLNAIVGLGVVGRIGDKAMDQYPLGAEFQVFGRLLWPLSGGSSMAAGLEVVTSPYGSGQGVSVAGLPTLMVEDLVGLAAGPVYYCDGFWTSPSGCSATRGGGMLQVSGDLSIEPLGLRLKGGVEGLSTKLVGDEGEEFRAFFGLDGFFGSSGSQD